MSRGWAKDSACHLQVSLCCAALCQSMSLQNLSRSSLHRLAGLPCRLFLSYGLQVVTREVHRSSLEAVDMLCPGTLHFSHVADYIYDFCPLPDPNVFPSVFIVFDVSVFLSILVCAAVVICVRFQIMLNNLCHCSTNPLVLSVLNTVKFLSMIF